MNVVAFFVGTLRGLFYVSFLVTGFFFLVSFGVLIYIFREVVHDPAHAADVVADVTRILRQIFHIKV